MISIEPLKIKANRLSKEDLENIQSHIINLKGYIEVFFEWENEEIITDEQIQVFIQFYQLCIKFKEQLNKKAQIRLVFKLHSNIQSIDERLFAYFLLFRQEFGNKIKVQFYSYSKDNQESQYINTIRQQAQNTNLYFRQKFIETKDLSSYSQKAEATTSKAFLPPILILRNDLSYEKKIGVKTYDYFFTRREHSIIKDLQQIYYGGRSIDQIKTQPDFEKAISKKIKTNDFIGVTYSYFVKALYSLFFLRTAIQTDYATENLEYFKVSNFSDSDKDTITDATYDILSRNNVYFFSPMEIYIFSILVIEEKLINKNDFQKNYSGIISYVNNYKNNLQYIIDQTKDICYGLHELAKNIVEHSSEGFGVITARRYRKEDEKALNIGTTRGRAFNDWFKNRGVENSFLELSVIDSGRMGLIEKYKESLKALEEKTTNESLRNHIKKDIDKIDEKNITIIDLLNYKNIQFLHQIHRSHARLGLLVFSNLTVGQRGGIIKASATNYDKIFQTKSNYIFIKDREIYKEEVKEDINIGTTYTFDIPINFLESDKIYGNKSMNASMEEQGTPTTVLQETLNYECITSESFKKIKDKTKKYIVDFRNHSLGIDSKDENKYKFIATITDIINTTLKEHKNRVIALLDAKKLNEYEQLKNNPSGWIRLLASIQFENGIPLIILNLNYKVQSRIVEINRLYDQLQNKKFGGFWKKHVGVIFYNKEKYKYDYRLKKQTVKLWFNNVLLGKTYSEYLNLNKQIATYQYNQTSINKFEKEEHKDISNNKYNIFFSGKTLINFELLIKEEVLIAAKKETPPNPKEVLNLSLFENSVRSLLNLDICTTSSKEETSKKDRFFDRFKGYKISDSHFKLGSKIHIGDFYYAKRLFYNSFYANRFAFLIARHLLMKDEVNELKRNKEKITLIGYGKYSELLVSNVRRILHNKLFETNKRDKEKDRINHDVFLEDKKVFKNINNLHTNVIIIIPISSTFSTGNKIRRWLEKLYQTEGRDLPKYIAEDINVLLIADKNYMQFETLKHSGEMDAFNQYEEFRWKSFEKNDNTTILLKVPQDVEKYISQKYFIPLLTTWQSIHNCKYCFPKLEKKTEQEENNQISIVREERCLLDTITNNVTPDMIFGLPLMPKIEKNNFEYSDYIEDEKSIIIKGHIIRENKPHQYYIRTGAFLKKNKDTIKTWLKEIYDKGNIINKKNIIITPSHTANSGFVNLVNEIIFDERATILQYSDADDLLENFIQFNSSFFIKANIFFVDDIIHSGKTFHAINNYLKQIDNKKQKPIKFDYVICMIKRTNYFHEQAIKKALNQKQGGRIDYYSALHLPSLETKHYPFPLVVRENLFHSLSENAVTDTLRFHFKELSNEFKAFDLNKIGTEPDSKIQDLFRTLVTHRLYQLFEGKIQNQEVSYSNKIKTDAKKKHIDQLLAEHKPEYVLKTLCDYVEEKNDYNNVYQFIESKEGKLFSNEIKNRIVYLFATLPLSHYKIIREIAFKWVLSELRDYVEGEKLKNNEWLKNMLKHAIIDKETNNVICGTQYNSYQTFRLYLRLGAELHCNYIFSEDMLLAIARMLRYLSVEDRKIIHYKENTDGRWIKDNEVKGKPISPIGFKTYYAGLVQQLIEKDEAKSAELIRNIFLVLKAKDTLNLKDKNSFNNHFIDLLRLLVLENTSIFDTYMNNIFKEKNEEIKKYTFGNMETIEETIFDFEEEILENDIQSSRYKAIKKLLHGQYVQEEECKEKKEKTVYKDSQDQNSIGKKENKKDLTEAFCMTLYAKTLLRNDIEPKNNNRKISIKEKLDIFLELAYNILDIKDGGAFFVARYKDFYKPEKDITSEDLYTITNFAQPKENQLRVDLNSNNSLVCKMFNGIKQIGSKKPMSIFEILYDIGDSQQTLERTVGKPQKTSQNSTEELQIKINFNSEKQPKYVSTEINNYDDKNININNCAETIGDNIYHNLLFLKISDIKEDDRHINIINELFVYIRQNRKSIKIGEIKKQINEIKDNDLQTTLNSIVKDFESDKKFENDKAIAAIKLLEEISAKEHCKVIDDLLLYVKIKKRVYVKIKKPVNEIEHQDLKTGLNKIIQKIENNESLEHIRSQLNEIKNKTYYVSKPLAVICFYNNKINKENIKQKERFNPKRLRLLLLLKNDIQAFIRHNIQNDSFVDFVNEQGRIKAIEKIKIAYDSRVDKFNHGAKGYIEHWIKAIQQENTNTSKLYALSQLVYSHINIGVMFARYIKQDKKDKYSFAIGLEEEATQFDNDELADIFSIFNNLSEYYNGLEIEFLEEQFYNYTTKIPFEIFKYFMLELISNAIRPGYNTYVGINILNNEVCIKYRGGKQMPDEEKLVRLKKYIQGENYVNDEFGIGIFYINKYLSFFNEGRGINVSIEEEDRKQFVVKF